MDSTTQCRQLEYKVEWQEEKRDTEFLKVEDTKEEVGNDPIQNKS